MLNAIWQAILSHLKSRKFRIAVIVVFANLLVVQVPELAPFRELLVLMLTVLASILIYAIAHEDAANATALAAEANLLSNEEALDSIRETVREVAEEVLGQVLGQPPTITR